MASLRRLPTSRFWIACYTDADGDRHQRSTKMTDRAKAQRVADAFEAAYKRKQTEAQIRRSMSAIFEDIHEEPLSTLTLDQWLNQWLERRRPEVDPATYDRYNDMATLVRKADADLAAQAKERGERYNAACACILDRLEPKHITAIRNRVNEIRAGGTTNQTLKILRMCLKAAWVEGLISENPAARVANVRDDGLHDSESRRPFTLDELAKILAAANDEWRGMIFAGFYTAGQRLSDIVTLTAGQVHLETRTVTFAATEKTKRPVIVPIVGPWLADLKKRVEGKPHAYRVFPEAYARYKEAGERTSRVSNTFRRILARVGLATKSNRKREGAQVGRRQLNPLSYHSFRHTATSLLKNSGVSDSVVMDIVGHESEAVSRNYTHIDDATKRSAMEKLPALA